MERTKWLLVPFAFWSLWLATACWSEALTCDKTLINTTLATIHRDQKFEEAMAMIKPCAEKGDSASQIVLSLIYGQMPGEIGRPDIQTCFLWSERATANGGIVALNKHGMAIFVLGIESGMRPSESRLSSLDWFLKAAEWGHPYALFKVGSQLKRYCQDDVIAYTFLTLAKRRTKPSFNYYGFITHDLHELQMSPDFPKKNIAEALRLADIWERNHPEAAKSWPTDDWVENMKGESAKEIPTMTSPPTSKSFCDIFGEIMMFCPQETEKTKAELKALRPEYVKKH